MNKSMDEFVKQNTVKHAEKCLKVALNTIIIIYFYYFIIFNVFLLFQNNSVPSKRTHYCQKFSAEILTLMKYNVIYF